MINLLYVLHSHCSIDSFANEAIPDAFAIKRVAEFAQDQTSYHNVIVVNDYYFTAFRAAICRGDIKAENIRMTLAHDGRKETRCVFSQSGVALLEGHQTPVDIGTHDVFEDLLTAQCSRMAVRRKARLENLNNQRIKEK